MKYTPREIREEVNVTPRHPLVNFGYLLGTVVSASLAVYVVLGVAVDWVVPQVSPELEARIGQATAPQAAALLGGRELPADPRRAYLQDLLDALQAGDRHRPATVHLIESEIDNAAALPGGRIFLTTSLLESVASENELAFILAHELGHHVQRDSLRQLGRSLVLTWGMQVVLGSSGSSDGAGVVGTTLNLQSLSYSRRAESAADRYALAAVRHHYGHVNGSLDFFQRLAAEDNQTIQRLAGYFQTHPATPARAEQLADYAAAQGWSQQGELTPMPTRYSQE